MALQDVLNLAKPKKKIGLSEERIHAQIEPMRKWISFWREYPDIFIDMITGPASKFKLFFYQRLFLRAVMRNKYTYATFPRAYSKSFLSIMALMIKCILFPASKLFITSGGKEQAANIAKEKIEELCDLIPAFKKEINWKKSTFGKDYVRVEFKNGSRLDVVAARQSARGGRRHGKEGRRHAEKFYRNYKICYNSSIGKLFRRVYCEFLFSILFIKHKNKQGLYRIYQ